MLDPEGPYCLFPAAGASLELEPHLPERAAALCNTLRMGVPLHTSRTRADTYKTAFGMTPY